MESDIATIVIRLAAEQAAVPAPEVSAASHFVNDLNFDSLDAVEFSMKVEDQLQVSIPDETLTQMHTVGSVIDYLKAQSTAGIPSASE